ncbi:DUF1419 domain-containing protein [Mesorhizobium sp. M1409]|uniref:DUF1419 domain-containing protein n=1 Tax=unclassified Mesorhizobium TaxID=325217 RepID=UPI003336ECE5
MTDHPAFRKVREGIASREQMFQLFDRHRHTPGIDPLSGTPYAGEWFEITASTYHFMLGLLPPLFMRTGMFGMSEYKAGYVTSVFFAVRIRTRERWFHGFCDLSDKRSPDAMRAAIIAHETGAADSMTREEKLEAIWNATHPDLKGIAGNVDPDAWPAEHRGKPTILVNAGAQGTVLKLLENLSDKEIDELLSVSLPLRNSRRGGDDADRS